MSHTDVNSVLLEPSKKDAATEIKLIKDIYYWDSSIESLANWIMASLWTAVNTKSQTEGDDYVFKYKESCIAYNFKQRIFTINLWSEENSFYTVGLHISSYLETLYGVKTFAEVETSLIFDIVEIENLSKTIARDVDTWITNVPNIYKEICAG